MPKAILEFNLPEEKEEFNSAINATRNEAVISEVINILAKVMNKEYLPNDFSTKIKANENLKLFCENLILFINQKTDWSIE